MYRFYNILRINYRDIILKKYFRVKKKKEFFSHQCSVETEIKYYSYIAQNI